MGMRLYRVEYCFIGNLGAKVSSRAALIQMHSGSESEALALIKQRENGDWRRYGENVEVAVLKIEPMECR